MPRKDPEATKLYWRAYYHRNKAVRNEMSRRSRATTRALAFEALGNKCAWCGLTTPSVLEIDHINGGGHAEVNSRRHSIRAAKGDVEGLQLLCANCHREKTYGASAPTWINDAYRISIE